MATWPSYAGIRHEGFAEQRESALMRTEMESGPPRQTKVRSRVLVTDFDQVMMVALGCRSTSAATTFDQPASARVDASTTMA